MATKEIQVAPCIVESSEVHLQSNLGLRRAICTIVALSIFSAFLYRHVLSKLVVDCWNDPNYSHAFVMPVFVGFVIWTMRGKLRQMELEPSWWGFLAAVLAITLLVIGDLGAELFSSRVSMLVLLSGMILLFLGWNYLRALLFPISMLLLMIPIPTIAMNKITFPLQLNASKLATGLLSVSGVPVLRDGNVINLPSTSLEVIEACSGIRSLISLIALAAIFGYLRGHRPWHRWLLVILAVPIAVVANSVRIMGTGLLAQYWDPDKAEGFFHMFEGWVVFVLSLAFLLLVDKAICQISRLRKEGV